MYTITIKFGELETHVPGIVTNTIEDCNAWIDEDTRRRASFGAPVVAYQIYYAGKPTNRDGSPQEELQLEPTSKRKARKRGATPVSTDR